MKLAIMQPYAFPYIGYFQLMNLVDEFVFYDDVNFIKKGFINKNNILINGEPKPFVIPLTKVSQNKLINEVQIVDDLKWKKKFLTTITLNYKKASEFKNFYPILEAIIAKEYKSIAELAVHSNIQIAGYLSLSTKFSTSSTINSFQHLNGQNRILAICKLKDTTHYINPTGGMSLYSNSLFQENDIELSFINTDRDIVYNQIGNSDFVANLSIIDVLMNNSIADAKKLLSFYHLKSKS